MGALTESEMEHAMKLTPWFPGNVKPVRVGVYRRKIGNRGEKYQYWTGAHWGLYCHTVNNAAMKCNRVVSSVQTAPWQGIAR